MKISKVKTKIFLLLFPVIMITSCNLKQKEAAKKSIKSNYLYATLYNRYAAEYKALTYQAYNIATERLIEIRKENEGNDRLAVVLDIDETLLDNSPYQAKIILENIEYDSLWSTWCKMAVAEAIPGVIDFVNLADSLGFHLFYLSNRKDFVKKPTILNMKNLNFPQVTENNFLLRTETPNKQARRKKISEEYEIVLLVGDNLGDFYTDAETSGERDQQVKASSAEFGKKFIILPNAIYGNWVESLDLNSNPDTTKTLLRNMTGSFREGRH